MVGKSPTYGILPAMQEEAEVAIPALGEATVITIGPEDDRYTLRARLRRTWAETGKGVIVLYLPWEVERRWRSSLDYRFIARTSAEEGIPLAWVIEDPERRPLAREAGFRTFASLEAVRQAAERGETFPIPSLPKPEPPPPPPPWADEPVPPPLPLPRPVPRWRQIAELALLGVVLLTIGALLFLTIPSARIVIYPQGTTYAAIVPVSVDPEAETVDLQRNVVPSRRIGDEFEAYVEVPTTGEGYAFTGKAKGMVVFTNLLGQDYTVPKGTIVRTSAGSYPVRFQTTEDVVVPPMGQASAPVEALEEGPKGNVGAYQINFVEGVVGFAVKVTNPQPITGAASEIVHIVSEEDRQRAWKLAARQVLEKAYEALRSGDYLQEGELLPRQTLIIQAVPKAAYTHLVGEQADTLGVTLRLLVTAQAVKASDVQQVAYRHLLLNLPQGYLLTDARFEYGESAEEEVGPGLFTFYVTAHGFATARINEAALRADLQGMPRREVADYLERSLPLAAPPRVEVQPRWFPFIPHLPLRLEIQVVPAHW